MFAPKYACTEDHTIISYKTVRRTVAEERQRINSCGLTGSTVFAFIHRSLSKHLDGNLQLGRQEYAHLASSQDFFKMTDSLDF